MNIEGIQYPINDAMINEFQSKYNIWLPNSYKEFLKQCNGGNPVINCFRTHRLTSRFYNVIPLRELKSNSENRTLSLELYYIYFTLGNKLPKDFLPIGLDPAKDFICVSIEGGNKGKIFLCDLNWKNDEGTEGFPTISLISNSFEEFIDNLFDHVPEEFVSDYKHIPQERENITIDDIRILEIRYNIKLPIEYKEYLLKKNGESMGEKEITFNYKGECFNVQTDFFFSITNNISIYNLEQNYKNHIEEYKGLKKYFPIAVDIGGDFLCISLNDFDYGKIYWMSHEFDTNGKNQIILIKDDFKQFLEGLRDID